MDIKYSEEVATALSKKRPIVALESTVIAHGLPYPQNLDTAFRLEEIIRAAGAIPATIAIFHGKFCVGLDHGQIDQLATDSTISKVSRRDLPIAVANFLNCATTVATTAFIAHRSGIRVFATGGIGGVHRGLLMDVSADLPELARTPITIVCSGAKIVLDLPATREWLETHGVTILGWKCDELPAFYSRVSGLSVDERVDSADEVAGVATARDQLALPNAILVTVPVPATYEISRDALESLLADSIKLAEEKGIRGKALTPFLLSELSRLSEGRTLEANIALLESNAQVAAEVAIAIHQI